VFSPGNPEEQREDQVEEMSSVASKWILFRIDPEVSGDPVRSCWRARIFHASGCSEYSISVDFAKCIVELREQRFAFQLVGTNLSRELRFYAHPVRPSAVPPFRKTPEGSWTVLRVFAPDEDDPSFLLGLNPINGQGIVILFSEDNLAVFRSLFGSIPSTNGND
jgi:hypothetical protein